MFTKSCPKSSDIMFYSYSDTSQMAQKFQDIWAIIAEYVFCHPDLSRIAQSGHTDRTVY